MNTKQFIFVAILFSTLHLFAQTVVTGTVKDSVSNEAIFGAIVMLDGAGKAKTDFDGNFKLQVPEGEHTITVTNSLEGYLDWTTTINASGEEINLQISLAKEKGVQVIKGATVVGVKKSGGPTSIASSDAKRMDEAGATDGMPKEIITNSGVPSASEAVQMIPAASVQDGKNVYVRGLGDRYSKTILNEMDLPGLDPDKNSVQLDVFPAVLIDNITIYKTFTPNLTGDFTGGLVDITTKDFPATESFYAKFSLGYNSISTFNPDFLTYKGSGMDFLAFGYGDRKLPIQATKPIPHTSAYDDYTTTATRKFDKVMAPVKSLGMPNYNFAVAYGNQYKLGKEEKIDYGFNAVLNYRTSNNFYTDAQYNEFRRNPESNDYELFQDRTSFGQVSEQDIMWTALLGQSIKVNRSKISLNLFHTQNGVSSASILRQINSESNPATLVKTSLAYQQRSISNLNINGVHFLNEKSNLRMKWKLTPTYSRISDPDLRSTVLEEVVAADGRVFYELNPAVGSEIRRTFRDLKEINVASKVDFEYDFMQWDSLKSTVSFGVYNLYKNRAFDVDDYTFDTKNTGIEVPNDPNWFFQSENIWTPETNQGTFAVGNKEMANVYQAWQNISAAYIMNELPISKKFSATYGARVEKNVNYYTGETNNAANDPTAPRYNNEKVLDELSILPSLNVVYKIRKKGSEQSKDQSTNIRGAYAKTLARPSFREISISQIYDPIQGRRYLGNIDLKQTDIHNVDLRFEHFFGNTELISVSGFYKHFINPIEVVANVAAPNELKPVNAGQANLYGAEFEIRKSLAFNRDEAKSLVAGFNVTYVLSQVDMSQVKTTIGTQEFTELEIRQANAKDGEVIDKYRTMYGQSPVIVNSFLTFKEENSGLTANLAYNVQGKRLVVIGVGSLPDVYERPFHALSVKVSKKFGRIGPGGQEGRRWTASLTGNNLLNNAKRRYYEAYNAQTQVYDYLNQGVSVSFSMTYNF